MTTNGGGIANFDEIFVSSLPASAGVTTTATDADGNTSEFSSCYSSCTPPLAPVVTISLAGVNLNLAWATVPSASRGYNIYRSANQPYFTPTAPPYATSNNTNWQDPAPNAVGDVANNYFYVVRAANNCAESIDSNRTGEFDFRLVPGSTP